MLLEGRLLAYRRPLGVSFQARIRGVYSREVPVTEIACLGGRRQSLRIVPFDHRILVNANAARLDNPKPTGDQLGAQRAQEIAHEFLQEA